MIQTHIHAGLFDQNCLNALWLSHVCVPMTTNISDQGNHRCRNLVSRTAKNKTLHKTIPKALVSIVVLEIRFHCCKIVQGLCRIFATGMFQTSSKCYDRAVLLWSRSSVLATTLPNKKGSWVLGLQGSVAKIMQNPVYFSCPEQEEWVVA